VRLNRDVLERYRRAVNASRESTEQLGARIRGVSTRDEDLGTAQFDAFVGGLDYPVFVVTAANGEERSGCLVGFATQASIRPPRMLVCVSTVNHTYPIAREAALLAVHVLGPEQHGLAELFGAETGDEVDKFEQCRWRAGPGGVPLLEDCPRFMVGRVLSQHPFGDHVGFLLEPVAVDAAADAPAITLGDVTDIEPGHPA
jgi:flavin reductase (DIM6/NTAB) family NADH-FMN oxidoreductase RutF